MRMVPTLSWRLEGDPAEGVDARLLPLLESIAASASLAAAVAERGISYRAAWGLLRDYQRKLGTPLVLLERGRGAALAPAGERLVAARATATRRLARILPRLSVDISPAHGTDREPPMLSLRVAASHDLALAALAELLPGQARLALDLSFMGSLPPSGSSSRGVRTSQASTCRSPAARSWSASHS